MEKDKELKTEKKGSRGEKEILDVLKPIKAGNTTILDVGDKVIIDSKTPEPPLYKCMKCGTITNSLAFAQDICGRNVCPKCGNDAFTIPEPRENVDVNRTEKEKELIHKK